jgi:isoleucyl-tRNA synthetase
MFDKTSTLKEKKLLSFWSKNKIFKKLRKKNQGKKCWSFLDGPITANNPMGVHHAWGRTYKDLFQRYKAMQGFDQRFQNGFDCQGLWVEVEVEKEFGFKSKKDIEQYGIEKFIRACKKRVEKYSKIQTKQSIRLGQWMDWDNSYYTMSDQNNYAIWGFLKECWQKGILYKGRDVVPWCPRCGTSISQHEILTEEYKEVIHQSIFVKLPIIGRKNSFLLVWTTTPWTLPANVAVAVNPDLTYVEVKDKKGNKYILLSDKKDLITEGCKIINKFSGQKLKGLRYKGMFDQLFDAVKQSKAKYEVVLWDEVSAEEGTGLVHIAPGCGQEDFQLGKEQEMAVIDPVNVESRYKKGFGFLSGKLTSQVNNLIFSSLKDREFVFDIQDYKHRYPTCWRCKSELIFRLVDEWYISMKKLRKPLMDITKKIKWIPEFGLKRELDWLKNMQDWLISKKRYWGLALPIFECKKCHNFEVIGSKEELKKRAVKGWDKFKSHSPHRPWVDQVKIKCSNCREIISRIPDVGNPWLDAGIVPFSTIGYFLNKKNWQKWFPVDFICESFPGQFKNWFYSLIVMSTVLKNTNPSKTIFGYASVHDENDEEMHKSKGNAIWFDEAIEKIGADVMRWMYARQNPVENLRFGFNTANEVKRKLLTLYNSIQFFNTYASFEDCTANLATRAKRRVKKRFISLPKLKTKNILDAWIISRLNNLIGKTTKSLDDFNAMSAALEIEDFFINDLSLWYIRRSRKRFQSPISQEEKKQASTTLYCVIFNLIQLLSPIMPFFAEENYQSFRQKNMPESVHLLDWPKPDKKAINLELDKKMEKARKIVASVLAKRAMVGIKVRQPLQRLDIPGKIDKELVELIKAEVNVKKVVFGKALRLDIKITPELKEEGMLRDIIRHIQEMRKKIGLKPKDEILVECSGDEYLVEILNKNKCFILKEGRIKELSFKKIKESFDKVKEVNLDNRKLFLAIKKL